MVALLLLSKICFLSNLFYLAPNPKICDDVKAYRLTEHDPNEERDIGI